MLRDLDALMRARSLDAVLVPMHEAMHPSFRWLTRGAKVTRGYAVKLPDRDPVLVTYPMEREEAAATGLEVRLVHEFDHERIFRTAANMAEGYAELFGNVLHALGSEAPANRQRQPPTPSPSSATSRCTSTSAWPRRWSAAAGASTGRTART